MNPTNTALLLRVLALVCANAAAACTPGRGTIGALLARGSEGKLVVHTTPPELGSAKAGLSPGDEILLIDGVDVRFLTETEIHEALAGAPGEPVRLTVIRGREVLRITVKRTPAQKYPSADSSPGAEGN